MKRVFVFNILLILFPIALTAQANKNNSVIKVSLSEENFNDTLELIFYSKLYPYQADLISRCAKEKSNIYTFAIPKKYVDGYFEIRKINGSQSNSEPLVPLLFGV
jgi:hypothetical protein